MNLAISHLDFSRVNFADVSRFFLKAFLVCFPFQLQSLIYTGTSFLNGNFNPFTTFAVHVTDIFLVVAFISWACAHFQSGAQTLKPANLGQPEIAIALLLFIGALLGSVFVSADKVLSLMIVFRFGLFFLLYVMLISELLSLDEIITFFLAGALLQAFTGIAQYLLQHSLGLSLFGESKIDPTVPGVAKIDWDGQKIIRAYGTFPHANLLGGEMFMALIFAFYRYKKSLKTLLPILAIIIMAILLTFSRSAFFAVVAALLLFVAITENKVAVRTVILSVCIMGFFVVALNLEGLVLNRLIASGDDQAGLERITYMDISKSMLAKHPFGVGTGAFTLMMQDYTVQKLDPWLHQPVHNVFMLIANEAGAAGAFLFLAMLGIVFYLLVKALTVLKSNQEKKEQCSLFIAMLGGITVISLFDHYFFSLYQGQAMLMIYLAVAASFLKKSLLPRTNS